MMSSVLKLVVFSVLLYFAYSGPLHASCKITWQFGVSCDTVKDAIVSQINKWQGDAGCAGGGEKCLYVLKSTTDTSIKATHETPIKHYVDSLSFDFSGKGSSCECQAYSSSNTWYAVLDYGTNYCNLRNLIDGAGLSTAAGFVQQTSDDVCTQYSSHNCTRY